LLFPIQKQFPAFFTNIPIQLRTGDESSFCEKQFHRTIVME
jgi:hypothetical protein